MTYTWVNRQNNIEASNPFVTRNVEVGSDLHDETFRQALTYHNKGYSEENIAEITRHFKNQAESTYRVTKDEVVYTANPKMHYFLNQTRDYSFGLRKRGRTTTPFLIFYSK